VLILNKRNMARIEILKTYGRMFEMQFKLPVRLLEGGLKKQLLIEVRFYIALQKC